MTVSGYGRVGALYLDLLKKALTDSLRLDDPAAMELRAVGRDLPENAETMVGLRRLENVQHCIADVVAEGVPGDLVETGVWRGGVTIFMRACLKALGVDDRMVWVCDSF